MRHFITVFVSAICVSAFAASWEAPLVRVSGVQSGGGGGGSGITSNQVVDIVKSSSVTNAGAVTSAKAYADGKFLPLAGGTMTGTIYTYNGLVTGQNDGTGIVIGSNEEGGLGPSSLGAIQLYHTDFDDKLKIRYGMNGAWVYESTLAPDGTDVATISSISNTVTKEYVENLGITGGGTNKYTRNIRATASIGVHTVDPATGYVDLAMEGKTMQEGLEYLVQERKLPSTPTYPKITSVTLLGSGEKEVGETFAPSYTVNVSLGSYEYGPTPTGSNFDQFRVSDSNGNSATTQNGAFSAFTVLDSTSYKVMAKAHHTQGNQPKDNLGGVVTNENLCIQAMWYNKKSTEAAADSVSSGVVSGFRKWFIYIGTDCTTTIDSAFIRASQSYGSAKTASTRNGIVIPAGTKRVMVAMPKYSASLGYNKALTSVIDVDGMGLDIFSNFVKTEASVAAATTSAPSMDYNVWTFENPNGMASSHFNFVISTVTSLAATPRDAGGNGYENSVPLNISLGRQFYGPLDVSDVFYSMNDLSYYRTKKRLSEGVSAYWLARTPYPYDGQIVTLSLSSCTPTNYVLKANSSNEFDLVQLQYELVSGQTIKTVNGNSLLGSGNIEIKGGGGGITTNAVRDIVAVMPIVRTNETGIIQSAKITTAQVVDVPGLCFTASAPNSTITMEQTGTEPKISLDYTTDGTTWNTFISSADSIIRTVTLTNVGDRVWIRATDVGNEKFSVNWANYWRFVMSGSLSASGSIEYLRNKNGFISVSGIGRTYASLFENCTALTSAPELPAMTLGANCYNSMFEGCTSLTAAPALPATNLAAQCYYAMFWKCTSLTNAPSLPATTLKTSCYSYMFEECKSLISLPALQATELSNECYYAMFRGCTAIKLSKTKTSEYTTPYRIPSVDNAISVGHNSLLNMFLDTGGTFSGTPTANVTYYGAWDESPYVTSNTVNRMIAAIPQGGVTPSVVTGIVESASVTNKGANAYADGTFLPLDGSKATTGNIQFGRIGSKAQSWGIVDRLGRSVITNDTMHSRAGWEFVGRSAYAKALGAEASAISVDGYPTISFKESPVKKGWRVEDGNHSNRSFLVPDGSDFATYNGITNTFPVVTNAYAYTDASTLAATNFVKAGYLPLDGSKEMDESSNIRFYGSPDNWFAIGAEIIGSPGVYGVFSGGQLRFGSDNGDGGGKSRLITDGTPVVTSNMLNGVLAAYQTNLVVDISTADKVLKNDGSTLYWGEGGGGGGKLKGKVYDFNGGTNFAYQLYTTLTNVIYEMGGSVTNAPSFL